MKSENKSRVLSVHLQTSFYLF